MAASYVIYCGLLALCTAFAYLAERHEKKIFLWGIVTALTLIAGLRAESVGIDTVAYIEKFAFIADGLPQYAYGFEASFKWIVRGLLFIIPNPTFLFTVFALLTNWCIVWGLWAYRNVSSFAVSVACYYMGYFFLSLNGVRQLCAVAILLLATKHLAEHRYLRYLFFVALASLFHLSGWIGIAFLGVAIFSWKELSVQKRTLLSIIFACLPIPLYLLLREGDRYEGYFMETSDQIGIMIPLKLIFFGFALVFVFVLYGRERHFGTPVAASDRIRIRISCMLYAAGLLFAFGSYFIPILNRVGWYFMIFEPLCMGMLLKTKHSLHRYVFGWCVFLLMGYGFLHSMIENAQGTMPYLFFWQ